MPDDPYKVLGLDTSASAEDIKKAYRKAVRDNHPDLHPDDPEAEARFKAVSAAYDILKDPETRARYDRGEIDASGAERPERQFYRDYTGAAGNAYQGAREFHGFEGGSDIFEEILRGRARGRAGPGAGGFGGFGAAGPGGAGGFRARGPDARYALEVDFLEAAKGATKRITLPDGGTLDVKIPEGVEDGQTIRLRGKGSEGYGGGPPGDALVTLSVRPHPVFRREGADIHVTLPITLDEAVLGGKVAAPTIDGSVRVTVPEGASGGRTLRLRGRGVARGQGKGRGDQLVTLRIVSPPEIDDDLKRFMKEWRKTHAYDPRKGMT